MSNAPEDGTAVIELRGKEEEEEKTGYRERRREEKKEGGGKKGKKREEVRKREEREPEVGRGYVEIFAGNWRGKWRGFRYDHV